jgi:hypothetical protein
VQGLQTAYHVKDIGTLELLEQLHEDGLFGAVNFRFNDEFAVSRDLLDSILEINFLERYLRISQMPSPVFLDIRAGHAGLHIDRAAFCRIHLRSIISVRSNF